MMILAATDNPLFIIGILLAVFGSIAIAVFLARKYVPWLRDDDKPLSDEDAAKQTLERFLVPIKEDEEIIDENEGKKVEEIKENKDGKEE